MQIYIDIGNTNATIYKDDIKYSVDTIKNDTMFDKFCQYIDEDSDVFVVSVVPELSSVIAKIKAKVNSLRELSSDDFSKVMTFLGPDISQMGADRVAIDAFFANTYSSNCIIIDMGTAVTIDVIKDKTYVSGYIYPGIQTSLTALIGNASRLSEIKYQDLQKDHSCLTSESQINDGLIIGAIGALNNLVNFAQIHFDQPVKVYITGGYFNMIKEIITPSTIDKLIDFDYVYVKDAMKFAMEYLERELD